jgi:hypothetical protein
MEGLRNSSVVCLSSLSLASEASSQHTSTYKAYAEVSPYYSSSEPIVYQAVSSNGEQLLFASRVKNKIQLAVYLAQSNGTRLTRIFSSAYYNIGNEEVFFAPLKSPPAISGNGEFVVMGVKASLDINRRNDWMMVYNTKTQRRIFVPLRQLISGTNYVKLPETNFEQSILSMDYEGKRLVCQIETGLDTPSCKSGMTLLVLVSNTDGSNQQILLGPEDFSRTHLFFPMEGLSQISPSTHYDAQWRTSSFLWAGFWSSGSLR